MIALGGDGTFNEVVNGIRPGRRVRVRSPAAPRRCMPAQLGYPDDPVAAASMLARAIAAHSRPLGRAGRGRRPPVHVRRQRRLRRDCHPRGRRGPPQPARQRAPGDLRVLYEALRVLGAQGFRLAEQMTVTAEADAPLRASYIAIANQHPYTYFGKLPVKATPRAGFDSALDAVVLGRLGKRALPRLALYALAWPRHARTSTPGDHLPARPYALHDRLRSRRWRCRSTASTSAIASASRSATSPTPCTVFVPAD